MSSNNTKSNYHFHKESDSDAVREHIRAFERAKMERLVRANANTPVGAGIRKKSAAQAERSSRSPDDAPLVLKRPDWTTEERWHSAEDENNEAGKGREAHHTAAPTQEVARESVACDSESGGRKSSIGQKVGEQAFMAATGYTMKKDRFGMYPI
jgi:hypothetical protein